MKRLYPVNPISLTLISSLTLMACGGGGGSSSTPTNVDTVTDATWEFGVFENSAALDNLCATPRTGIDPFTGLSYPDVQGRELDEKLWLRSWSNETYLWYDEIEDVDPNSFSVLDYFGVLKTEELTESGAPRDNFHFFQSTQEYNELTQSGVSSEYGFDWEFVQTFPPRELIVRFTEPNSPAALAAIPRGASLLAVDNIDFVNDDTEAGVDALNDALFPTDAGQTHSFTFALLDGTETTVTLTSEDIEVVPVQNVQVLETVAGDIGYMQFNTFIPSAQEGLIDAFETFADNNVDELIIDLRYNGGGRLALASQIGYMVAGPGQTDGLTFELLQFNDKNPNTNPVTGESIDPIPFYSLEIDYDQGVFTSNTLPSPSLSRVYVITTDSTCSASESLMNSLLGIDVEVVQIGSTTCGKPYGFYPTDNCGTTYFTIQFQGVNEKGFGDYAAGFTPTDSPTFDDDVLGCVVADDFTKAMGDTEEGMLAATLEYIETGSCSEVPAERPVLVEATEKGLSIKTPNQVFNQAVLQNKIVDRIR